MQTRSQLFIFILLFTIIQACVPAKQFETIQNKSDKCEEELEMHKESVRKFSIANKELKAQLDAANEKLGSLKSDSLDKKKRIFLLEQDLERLSKQYSSLEEAQNNLLEGNIEETREILKELQRTQEDLQRREDNMREISSNLQIEKKNLTQIQKELEERNKRLVELERILYRKDSVVQALKTKVSDALLGFTNEGLDVFQKNGKVYVSLDEQLLFKSGKTDVDPRGVSALKKLSDVLAKNEDISIMVEGHTDDVPFNSGGVIKDNWDLSVKRATAIVRILMQNNKIKGDRILAAGRSKYHPIDPQKTTEARKKNRRTEIILTPKLDELLKILEN